MKATWFGAVAVLFLAVGCGGRTDENDEAGGSDEPPTSTPDEDAGGGKDPPPSGGVALPGCEEGFDKKKEPYRSCNWVAKGYCYEDKLEACACVCPQNTSVVSNCASGFPVEDGEVEVYCY
jgi:hypothetical protein